MNCRHCGKFTPRCTQKRRGRRKYCNAICYGLGQRGKSRDDRTSPSKKVYIQIRHEDGTREYWHRFVYRQENGDIPEGFVIHHKNEMKHDNGPDNLGALPANEHTPNEHWHWRTREPDRERYIPVGEMDPDIPF